jgi:hypothetical protein
VLDRLTEIVKGELGRFGPAEGLAELVAAWPAAVGAPIAAKAWPARLARDGTLHVNTADAIWAFELGQRAGEIAGRIGVSRVRFAPGPLAGVPAADRPEPSYPSPLERARAEEIVAQVSSEKLRETLGKTVSLGLARAASGRPV